MYWVNNVLRICYSWLLSERKLGIEKIYTLISTNAALLDFRQSYSLKEARCHFSILQIYS